MVDASMDQGAFTGKTRVTVNAPAMVILKLVSRPEYKLRWEKALLNAQLVKEFSPDFTVLHCIYEAPAVILNRDAVLAYLTVQRPDGSLFCLARSVPYGNIPVPANHLRLNVDISGYLIRPVTATSCTVTSLLQLREVRRTNAIAWKVARRKRMISILRLKEYAESLSVEELNQIAPPQQASRKTELRSAVAVPSFQIGRSRK